MSASALLRAVRASPAADRQNCRDDVRVLGVDDWALRKGRTYGTILVDLERHEPIELFPVRAASELAVWLRAHPSVTIISRDRGKEYAEGGRLGAPQAVQVADRWHLLKNLGDVLERLLTRYHGTLRAAAGAVQVRRRAEAAHFKGRLGHQDGPPTGLETDVDSSGPPVALTAAERDRAARRARRVGRYERVCALRAAGQSLTAIARELGLDRRTVRKFARAESFPERAAPRPGPASLLRYEATIRAAWTAGNHSGQALWQVLAAEGYPGSAQTVRRALARWQAEGVLPRRRALTRGPNGMPPTVLHPLAPRHAAWLLMQPTGQGASPEGAMIEQLRVLEPALDVAAELGQAFRRLVRERNGVVLTDWLHAARASGVPELRSFAMHLEHDAAAAEAGLTLPWSNGQTEGQITRLKLIKRQMYGRAHLDLLRRRVLYRG